MTSEQFEVMQILGDGGAIEVVGNYLFSREELLGTARRPVIAALLQKGWIAGGTAVRRGAKTTDFTAYLITEAGREALARKLRCV